MFDFDDADPQGPLDPFLDDGWIDEVLHEVKSGKEATVYCCRATPSTGLGLVAAKVYRPRQARTFKNDAIYHEGRVILKERDRRAVKGKTAFGREVQFGSWIDHEYATLGLLHAAGADVPQPLTRSSSAILMSYLGEAHDPAPHLQNVSLEQDEARDLFQRIIRNVELWLAHSVVHADLSPFNILYWQGAVTVIDFPQAIDARVNPNAYSLLLRDVSNVWRYFARYGVQADPERLAGWLWRRFVRGEL